LSRVFIIYRTSAKSKKYLSMIFEDVAVDDVISTSKRKPLIPYEWELEVVSVGINDESIEKYKKEYKIK